MAVGRVAGVENSGLTEGETQKYCSWQVGGGTKTKIGRQDALNS